MNRKMLPFPLQQAKEAISPFVRWCRAIWAIRHDMPYVRQRLVEQDMFIYDLIIESLKERKLPSPFSVKTEHPIAYQSDDHLNPAGTAADNTRSRQFVRACEGVFGGTFNALDLGCAGGGLVYDFVIRGHSAMGLEGSDYSQKTMRAMWGVIPEYLSTADVTKPFRVVDKEGKESAFNVISAWEVLEHIREDLIPGMMQNIASHLTDDGYFVASVATFEHKDKKTGAVYHVTVKPKEWWVAQLERNGLEIVENSPFKTTDFVRGIGYSPKDWNVHVRPDMGFHIVARKKRV